MKKITCFSLALLVCLSLISPALAVNVEEKFPAINRYTGYPDVAEGDWFATAAQACFETGLLTGTEAGFSPDRVLTVGEVAAIAARMNEALTGQVIPAPTPNPAVPWYQHYVDYLEGLGIPVPGGAEQATRLLFLTLLSPILSDEILSPMNQITSLPDASDATVIRFYNAGVLTGVDKYGTFSPNKTLTRAEAAAMVARVVRPALRLRFAPADYTPFLAAGCAPGDIFFRTAGKAVSAEEYLLYLNVLILQLEEECSQAGLEFNWFHTYGEQTFLVYVKETGLSHFGLTKNDGTELYRNFDLQVYYSRLLDAREESVK